MCPTVNLVLAALPPQGEPRYQRLALRRHRAQRVRHSCCARLSSQALSENIEGSFFTGHSLTGTARASAFPSLSSVTVPARVKPRSALISAQQQVCITSQRSCRHLPGRFRALPPRVRTVNRPERSAPPGFWILGQPAIFDALVSQGDAHAASSSIYNGDRGGLSATTPLLKGGGNARVVPTRRAPWCPFHGLGYQRQPSYRHAAQ